MPEWTETHCRHGHERTPENTYTTIRDGKPATQCKACVREVNVASWRDDLGTHVGLGQMSFPSYAKLRRHASAKITRFKYGMDEQQVRDLLAEAGGGWLDVPSARHEPATR